MNAPLQAALARVARARFGRADARTVDRVARAVVDLPASGKRCAPRPPIPGWLADDVAESVRELLG